MKFPQSIDGIYLTDLSHQIQTLPPDEAAIALLECGTIVLLAGHFEIAYKLFLKLLTGELKISEQSSLAHLLKSIVPSLCYSLKLECPAIFEQQSMSLGDLEWFIEEKFERSKQVEFIDRWFHLPFPSSDWSEDFIWEMTHQQVNITGDKRFEAYRFIQDLHRIICRDFKQGKLQDAKRFLLIAENTIEAWKIGYKSYVEYEILMFGILIYLELNDVSSADEYIKKYWNACQVRIVYSIDYLPDLMQRISEGALQNEIKISRIRSQELLSSIDKRTYDPQQIRFIPTVEDWNAFLEQWNDRIFELIDREDEEELEWYEDFYPEVISSRQCLRTGATETQIIELERKLDTEFSLAYRNFLLASNGFIILNRRCEIYGTDKIDWFINENQDWVDAWNNSNDEISDKQYFQYGAHQDCCWIRTRYMKTALQISSTEDGDVYLLNPLIIDRRNEWEAWNFGNKNPGAYRYRSCWEMMQAVYNKNFEI